MCTFSSGKKQIRENTCLEQHAFVVDPLGVFQCFYYLQTFMFVRSQTDGTNWKKKVHFGSPFFELGLQNCRRPHFDPWKWAPEGPFRVLEEGRSEIAGHPYSEIFLHGDDVQGFDTRWDEVVLSIHQVPSNDMLESLYKDAHTWVWSAQTAWASYEQDIEQHNSQPCYQKLKTIVKRCLEQKIRVRNVEARYERIETGVPATDKDNEKPVSAGRSQGGCFLNGQRNDSALKETLVVSAILRTNVENQCAHPLLLQNHRRKAMGKFFERKVLKGRTPSGKRYRRPCKDYIFGTCTNTSWEYWHPPVRQHSKTGRCADSVEGRSCAHWSWQSAKQTTEKEWWKKFCCAIEEFQANQVAPKSNSILHTEGFKLLGTKAQRAILKGCITRCDSATWAQLSCPQFEAKKRPREDSVKLEVERSFP